VLLKILPNDILLREHIAQIQEDGNTVLEGALALHVKMCGHVLIVVVGWAFGLLLVKPRPTMANITADAKLQALRLAVEELQSRREDGMTEFTKEESAVGRLVRSLDAILNACTHDQGGALDFLDTALQTYKVPPAVLEPLNRARSRQLPTNDDTFRLWLLFALNANTVLETLRQTLQMQDILVGFYIEASPLHNAAFVNSVVSLIAAATTHPVHGTMVFKLDVSGLGMFEQEEASLVVRRRSATMKNKAPGASPAATGGTASLPVRKKRPATGAATLESPSHHTDPADAAATEGLNLGTPTSIASGQGSDASGQAHPQTAPHGTPASAMRPAASFRKAPTSSTITTVDTECQTEVSGVGSSFGTTSGSTAAAQQQRAKAAMVHRDTNTDDPAPGKSYEEMKQLERVLIQRDKVNREMTDRLRRESEDLEEKRDDLKDSLDNVVTVLKSLKTLYNYHFMVVKESQDANRTVDRNRVDALLPRIMAVLNGADSVGDGGTNLSVSSHGNNGAEHGSHVSSPAAAGPAGSFGGSMVGNDGSGPIRPRLDSSLQEGGLSRTRSMTLPPPDTAPIISRGARPWKVDPIVEVERMRQLDLQHYRCAACQKELPNPNNSNILAKAFQRTAKPRRCHYSGELYCHDCHTNKKMILPFLVVQSWDFSEQHVSNRDFDFLQAHFTKPMISLHELAPDVRNRSIISQAAALRHNLASMYAILYTCPDARNSFGAQLGHYYFLHELYYSVSDLLSLRNRVEAEAGRGGGVNRLLMGNSGIDVISVLEGLAKTGREHIIDKCHHCRARAVKRCTLCGDADPVIMFENGALCKVCQKPFHVNCLALGCSECDARKH
jgi:hypothetical protein